MPTGSTKPTSAPPTTSNGRVREPADLASLALPTDDIGLLAGLTTTRAIRRYRDEPVPPDALRAMLFAATRAPSGSNRQPFRFVILTDGPKAIQAKRLIGDGAQHVWEMKRRADGYDRGSGTDAASPKSRLARSMDRYVAEFERVPVVILPSGCSSASPTA
jgi:Nitroreductase family